MVVRKTPCGLAQRESKIERAKAMAVSSTISLSCQVNWQGIYKKPGCGIKYALKHESKGLEWLMESRKSLKMSHISGQTATEYSLMLLMFMLVAVTMLLLLSALNGYGWRILSLVGLDYP
jgi:hypothetical protein